MRPWLLIAVLALGGCGSLDEDLAIDPGELPRENLLPPEYGELFPYYVELLAGSQIRARDGQAGGTAGHMVLYLHGAERDPEARYPQLRVCPEERAGVTGVGVSANRWFRNVNWVGVPDREFFLHGALARGERVDQEAIDTAAAEAIERGIYEGVEVRDDYPADGPRSLEDFVRRQSLGTDFALTFARSAFGVRVPVTRDQMREITVFLNDLNRQYFEDGIDYEWSGLRDNCAHLVHNALASAGFWEPKTAGHFKSDLALPANEFLTLLDRVAEFPIDDHEAIRDDPVAHDALLQFGWLPRTHGALLTTIDVHADNEAFDPTFRLFLLETSEVRHQEELVREDHLLDLRRNLDWFRTRYREMLAARPADRGAALQGDRDRMFRRRYYAYLEEMLAHVEERILILERQEMRVRSGAR